MQGGSRVLMCACEQLGGKGFGEPLVFDNQYYRTLLAAPWADPSNSMGYAPAVICHPALFAW